ncbi:MAG: coproporphyrinogen III oxidase, partial [Burkholderiales bacterium]
MDTPAVKDFLSGLQTTILARLEEIDAGKFRRDTWERVEGGGGLSCIVEDSAVLERGGVNLSHVFGAALPPSASAARPDLAGRSFEALGLSLVLHPHNPYAPSVHMNVRFVIASKPGAEAVWWFGGGMDLT